jgi:D-alanyl-D-alanine carboxypeptidase
MTIASRRWTLLLLVIVATGCGLHAAAADAPLRSRPPVTVPQAEMQHELDQMVASTGAPGAVLAIRVRGGPLTTFVSGSSDPKLSTPMREDAPFYIASITKTFVATDALLLVEHQKIGLDDPINRHLPSPYPNGDQITIRQLLNHTSGLPPVGGENGSSQYAASLQARLLADLNHRFTIEEIFELVRDRPLLFAPGTATSYSNLNTILLGQIIEYVTKHQLGDDLRANLLRPLRLTSTAYVADAVPPRPPIPGLFQLNGTGPLLDTADYPSTAIVSSGGASGAMVSDAPNLVRWASALYRDRTVLNRATSSAAFRIGPGGTGLGVIGFGDDGFCVFNNGGCPSSEDFYAIGAAGTDPGTSVRLLYDTRTDTVLALLVNRSGIDIRPTLVSVMQLVDQAEHER